MPWSELGPQRMAAATRQSEHPSAQPGADTIGIGARTIALSDVVGYELVAEVERDWEGQLVCAMLYGTVSSLLLIAIMVAGVDWKFLIAVGFLGAISAMSLSDALSVKPVTVYRLAMTLADGTRADFVTPELQPAQALVRRIQRAG